MKKLILLCSVALMFSCDGIESKDKVISQVLKIETEHLKTYNELQRRTKDTAVLNYITKLKDTLKLNAIEARGVIKSNSGMMYGSMTNSKAMLEEYIKLCK